jgi:chromosome partitioning protein
MKATLGNIKGGVAKTTSSVHLALALAARGERVLLADADVTNRSCLKWKALATDWPAAVVVLGFGDDLARQVNAMAGDYDSIVIDTSPQHAKVLRQALMVTDDLIVPVAPSPIELEQLGDTFGLAAEVDAVSPVFTQVLLVKVRAGTRSAIEARNYLTEHELPVMEVSVHLREAYSLAYGSAPADFGEYAGVLAELTADAGRGVA